MNGAYALVMLVVTPTLAMATEQILTVNTENDSYTNSGDDNYTNGLRVAWLDASFKPPAVAEWLADQLPVLDATKPMLVQYSLGQNMYTPKDITRATAQPNDRPWAGFLYGSMALTSGDREQVDDVELNVGIVGPSALAGEAQRLIHRLGDYRKPRGWDNQLHDEPALNLMMQRRWPTLWEATVADTAFYLSPHVGAAVGNVYTHAATGVTLRWDSRADAVIDNPMRVRPSPPGTGYFQTSPHPVVSLFVGAEGRAVARNIFLDGNTFRDSPHVNKKNLVADLQAGTMLTYDRFQAGYTVVYRTQEFYGQPSGEMFGGFNFAVKF